MENWKYWIPALIVLSGIVTLHHMDKKLKYQKSSHHPVLPRVVQVQPLPTTPVMSKVPTGPWADEFSKALKMSMGDRVAYWSGLLWKSTQAVEELKSLWIIPIVQDDVPVIPEKLNCTTFIETVIALAVSFDSSEVYQNLISIRYRDGHATFVDRNHFPEGDWIPNNERMGIVRDITSDFAKYTGIHSQVEAIQIHRDQWIAKQVQKGKVSRAVASVPSANYAAKILDIQLPYIGLSDLEKVLDRFPSGSIINFVYHRSKNFPVLIRHQGFIIREGQQVFLRHTSIDGQIKTESLLTYLKALKKQSGNLSSLIGINLNHLIGPKNRVF